MHRPLVYLAGAIAGIPGTDAVEWRWSAAKLLEGHDIEALDPMRHKNALYRPERISTDYRDYADRGPFYTSRGIMARDFNDVKRADALLVNLLGLTKPSLGTCMELAWAYALQKPAVVVMEREGDVTNGFQNNPHDLHPMLHEAMPFRVETLEEGVDVVATVLNR